MAITNIFHSQRFTGHPNPVTDLLFAPMTNGKAFKDECYFLSISEDDHLINAWYALILILLIAIFVHHFLIYFKLSQETITPL